MARSRILKPQFFLNDLLGRLPPLARLLFQGLWCLADREGRLEDRPARIKAEILPYDDVDANQLLQQLQEAGFIQRYIVNQQPYIQVITFAKHQRPHIKELPSSIPAPIQVSASTDLNPTSTNPGEYKPDQNVLATSYLNRDPGLGANAPLSRKATTKKQPPELQELFTLWREQGLGKVSMRCETRLKALLAATSQELIQEGIKVAAEKGIGNPMAWLEVTVPGWKRERAYNDGQRPPIRDASKYAIWPDGRPR